MFRINHDSVSTHDTKSNQATYNRSVISKIDVMHLFVVMLLLKIVQQVSLETVIPAIGQLFNKKEGQRYELRRTTVFKIP